MNVLGFSWPSAGVPEELTQPAFSLRRAWVGGMSSAAGPRLRLVVPVLAIAVSVVLLAGLVHVRRVCLLPVFALLARLSGHGLVVQANNSCPA